MRTFPNAAGGMTTRACLRGLCFRVHCYQHAKKCLMGLYILMQLCTKNGNGYKDANTYDLINYDIHRHVLSL